MYTPSPLLFLSNFIRLIHTSTHKRHVLRVHRVQRSKNYFHFGKGSGSQRRRNIVVEASHLKQEEGPGQRHREKQFLPCKTVLLLSPSHLPRFSPLPAG